MAPRKGKKAENEAVSTFSSQAEALFGTSDLYELLNLTKKTAGNTTSQIKKAYYKASLKFHPDRVHRAHEDQDQEGGAAKSTDAADLATQKFQLIGKAYAILSDKEKRNIYDETGVIEDESVFSSQTDWNDYWRLLFKPVTLKDLEDFDKGYKGSDEERDDVKCAYVKHEGDMDLILDEILCATQAKDEERLKEIIQNLIEEAEVPDFPKFSKESDKKKSARKRRAAKEAEEAESAMEEIKAKNGGLGARDDDDFLKKMIQKRQGDRGENMDSFFDNLAAKYSNKKGGAKKKK